MMAQMRLYVLLLLKLHKHDGCYTGIAVGVDTRWRLFDDGR